MSDATYQTKVYETNGGDKLVVASGGIIEVDPGGAIQFNGVALNMRAGQHTMLSASDTIVTGLTTVVAAFADLESPPVLTCDRANAEVGNQAGAPAAGSIILNAYMPVDATHTTPIAATGFAGMKVNWLAVGQ